MARPTLLALGNDGTVIGWSGDQSRTSRAFRWKDGRFTALQALPGDRASEAWGISPSGTVAGTRWTSDTVSQAVVWPAGSSVPIPLGYLPGGPPRSQAYAINDAGVAVGGAYVPGSWARPAPVVYGGGTARDLQPGTFSEAFAVNARGTILGGPSAAAPGPFVVRGGVPTAIGCMSIGSLRNALSEDDVVVGGGLGEGGRMRWKDGACTPMPAPHEARRAVPIAINATGTAVGGMSLKSEKDDYAAGIALVWPAGGGVRRLDMLLPKGSGWKLQGVVDINDAGQVLGSGLRNGKEARFLLSPEGGGAADDRHARRQWRHEARRPRQGAVRLVVPGDGHHDDPRRRTARRDQDASRLGHPSGRPAIHPRGAAASVGPPDGRGGAVPGAARDRGARRDYPGRSRRHDDGPADGASAALTHRRSGRVTGSGPPGTRTQNHGLKRPLLYH